MAKSESASAPRGGRPRARAARQFIALAERSSIEGYRRASAYADPMRREEAGA